MDYDFSGLCGDQLEKLEKRLNSLKKTFIKEYTIALNVINSPVANKHRIEITQEIADLFNDEIAKSVYSWKSSTNKVQSVLIKSLEKEGI